MITRKIHFTNVLCGFDVEWKAIQALVDKDTDMKLPTITKNTTPLKWCKLFKKYLHNIFGVRNIPLSYVIWKNLKVPPEAPPSGQVYQIQMWSMTPWNQERPMVHRDLFLKILSRDQTTTMPSSRMIIQNSLD